tara:strand:- start:252399 stop:252623 length:225 start_codon:yes stop_codon:yes gene_type:complete
MEPIRQPAVSFFRIHNGKGNTMLRWAIIFLVVALVAAVLGFGGIAGTAAGIAKLLALIFIVLFVVSLIFGGLRR